MATYLIAREITIKRQEGDVADVTFTVPSVLSMTDKGATFQVRNSGGRILMSKTNTDSTLTINGQVIYIPLLPADTLRKDGVHRWELQIDTTGGPITAGRGNFEIIKETVR